MTSFVIPPYTLTHYTVQEVADALTDVGFPANVIRTMTMIAGAESSWSNAIQKFQPYDTTGWGTWQITPGNSVPASIGQDMALLDLRTNARAALWKYQRQGLAAWSTYNSKVFLDYERYLPSPPSTAPEAHPITLIKGPPHDDRSSC